MGSSAYKMTHNDDQNMSARDRKREQKLSEKEIEEKKRKFREFLNVMGADKANKKQSWNDSFANFMENDGNVRPPM